MKELMKIMIVISIVWGSVNPLVIYASSDLIQNTSEETVSNEEYAKELESDNFSTDSTNETQDESDVGEELLIQNDSDQEQNNLEIIADSYSIQNMQPMYSFDHVKISNQGNLEFYGWMISKNMNITNPNDMKIEFVLSNNGDQVLATASRWERHDVTPIYGGGKYQYPWAGMRLNVDLSSLPVGTYEYHLRLSQPGYTTYGQVIPGTTTKIINGKKITISGSTIKVESAPIQTMQPVYSFDHVKIDIRGNLEFYGWMISKNMDLETASDMKIEFVLSNNGDQVLATAARWQRYDVTPIYGGGKYEYPWAGMRLNVDLGSLPVGTYGYHLRLSQPGYTTYGQVIPGTTTQVVNGKKITISGSTVKVTEHGEEMKPVISVDSMNLTEAGMLELSGWMISKNINIMSSTDLPIVAYIDGNPVATAQRWRRDDITPIYGGGKYQYPWAGFKISIDLSQLSSGEHSYELRLTQPGYSQASVYLPNVSIAENTKYKIVFSGTKMTKATQLANQGIVINSIDELYIHGEKLNIRGTAKLGANGSTSGTKQVVVLAANGHEYIQTVTDNLSVKYANEGFDLQQLPAGYYQLAVKLQNQLDLAVSKNTINLEMFTVRRNGKFKKINITAKANQPISIVVAELNANDSRYANVADVILDPGHGGSYGSSLGDSGACSQWISCESTEMLDLSKRIEARLEQHGLNVELTRTATYSNGELPQYGPNSRTNKVYESKAKISISNHYNSSTSSAPSGFMVIHSKNNNNILADKITRNLNSMTGAKGDSAMGTVCDRKLVTGYHTLYGYDISGNLANRDCYFMIREYGGKVTQGVNHDYSSREVSPEPLLAEYFFGSNYSDVTNYRNKKTQYIEAVVKAIVEYYGIPYIGTYTIIQESDIIESSIEQQTNQDEFNNMKY